MSVSKILHSTIRPTSFKIGKSEEVGFSGLFNVCFLPSLSSSRTKSRGILPSKEDMYRLQKLLQRWWTWNEGKSIAHWNSPIRIFYYNVAKIRHHQPVKNYYCLLVDLICIYHTGTRIHNSHHSHRRYRRRKVLKSITTLYQQQLLHYLLLTGTLEE